MTARPSHATGSTDVSLLETTIGADLAATVARVPDGEALVECATGRRWTYRQLWDDVTAVARGLASLGLEKGDRVGIWAPNCAEWTLVQYATARLGVVLVNVNPAYRAHELGYVVGQSGMRAIVAVPELKGASFADMIEQVRPDHPHLTAVVLIGPPGGGAGPWAANSTAWEALTDAGRASDLDVDAVEATLDPGDPINIQYTSGTTGFPKGATLSHRNILNNGFAVGELLHYTADDRIAIPVPFYHCFGMVMGNLAATSHGATMVIPAPMFDPAATLRAAAQERCTSLYGVPTMFIAMLSDPSFDEHDLSALRTGIMAGSPCPVEVMKQVIDRMGAEEVSICYGMTETSPVSTQTRTDDSVERRVSTVGRVHPNLEVKVVDPLTGDVVPRGTAGELCTRGYSVMLGYWEEPAKTAEAIDADAWMHTGDLAVMDDEGYVSVTGRIKDVVIRGGENIYPREVEEFLLTHPDVLDVQVVGVPDERYGEELMAWVRLRDGVGTLTVESVREFCTGRLAHYKVPRYVHVVEEFPMTVTGKVRKVEMREESRTLLGL